MSWMCLNYATYFRHIQDLSTYFSIISSWDRLSFSFMESLILNIIYVRSFFCLQIVQVLSANYTSHFGVDTEGYLVVAYFEKWFLILSYFFGCFILVFKLYQSGIYIITYLNVGIVSFCNLGIRKKRRFNDCLIVVALFPDFNMKQFWFVNYICEVLKLNFLLWICWKILAIYMMKVSCLLLF